MKAKPKKARKRKRKYRAVTEAELLDAILARRFATDDAGNVFSVNGSPRQLRVFHDPQKRPCVILYLGGGRRCTTLGRAVWMMANRQLVPEGFAVDHVNRDKTDNRPENLQLLEFSENSRQNQHWAEEDEF